MSKNPWNDESDNEESKKKFNFGIRSKVGHINTSFSDWQWVFFCVFLGFFIWLLTGFYIVNPKQEGIEMLFGRFVNVTKPGLHYNYPYPIGIVYTPSVTTINSTDIGFQRDGSPIIQESQMLTGDENILNVQFVVFWKIRDPEQYLFSIKNPEQTVKNVSEAAMREVIGKTPFEFARTTGRTEVALSVKRLVQQTLDLYHAGIEVVDLNIQRVDPPSSVINAFRDVQAARADQERSINEATGYKNRVIQHAQGMADQLIQEAEAYKQEKINLAQGEVKRFLLLNQEYRNNPNITEKTLYFDQLEGIFQKSNKIIIDNALTKGLIMVLPLSQLMGKTKNKFLGNALGLNQTKASHEN